MCIISEFVDQVGTMATLADFCEAHKPDCPALTTAVESLFRDITPEMDDALITSFLAVINVLLPRICKDLSLGTYKTLVSQYRGVLRRQIKDDNRYYNKLRQHLLFANGSTDPKIAKQMYYKLNDINAQNLQNKTKSVLQIEEKLIIDNVWKYSAYREMETLAAYHFAQHLIGGRFEEISNPDMVRYEVIPDKPDYVLQVGANKKRSYIEGIDETVRIVRPILPVSKVVGDYSNKQHYTGVDAVEAVNFYREQSQSRRNEGATRLTTNYDRIRREIRKDYAPVYVQLDSMKLRENSRVSVTHLPRKLWGVYNYKKRTDGVSQTLTSYLRDVNGWVLGGALAIAEHYTDMNIVMMTPEDVLFHSYEVKNNEMESKFSNPRALIRHARRTKRKYVELLSSDKKSTIKVPLAQRGKRLSNEERVKLVKETLTLLEQTNIERPITRKILNEAGHGWPAVSKVVPSTK
jgi:hypothetical protein